MQRDCQHCAARDPASLSTYLLYVVVTVLCLPQQSAGVVAPVGGNHLYDGQTYTSQFELQFGAESGQGKIEYRDCNFISVVDIGELVNSAAKTDGVVIFKGCTFGDKVRIMGHFADGGELRFIDCEFRRSVGPALRTTQFALTRGILLVHHCTFFAALAEGISFLGITATHHSRVAVQHSTMKSLAEDITNFGNTTFRLGGSTFEDSVMSLTHSRVICEGNHDVVDFGKQDDAPNVFTRSTLLIAHNPEITAEIKDGVEIYGTFTDSTVKVYNNTISADEDAIVFNNFGDGRELFLGASVLNIAQNNLFSRRANGGIHINAKQSNVLNNKPMMSLESTFYFFGNEAGGSALQIDSSTVGSPLAASVATRLVNVSSCDRRVECNATATMSSSASQDHCDCTCFSGITFIADSYCNYDIIRNTIVFKTPSTTMTVTRQPSATPTVTASILPTLSNSGSPTQTFSASKGTPTGSSTVVGTKSVTLVPTATASAQSSTSTTQSLSATASMSASITVRSTRSITSIRSLTSTMASTSTGSLSTSFQSSATHSLVGTGSATSVPTATASARFSISTSPSLPTTTSVSTSLSVRLTKTTTIVQSLTTTRKRTRSDTMPTSATLTGSSTGSLSTSLQSSVTDTIVGTNTVALVPTATASALSSTSSTTQSFSAAASMSVSTTVLSTRSMTLAQSPTKTMEKTRSEMISTSRTQTGSLVGSASASFESSVTDTIVKTESVTVVPTATASALSSTSSTQSFSATASISASTTVLSTTTQSAERSKSVTSSVTLSGTLSHAATITASQTPSGSLSHSCGQLQLAVSPSVVRSVDLRDQQRVSLNVSLIGNHPAQAFLAEDVVAHISITSNREWLVPQLVAGSAIFTSQRDSVVFEVGVQGRSMRVYESAQMEVQIGKRAFTCATGERLTAVVDVRPVPRPVPHAAVNAIESMSMSTAAVSSAIGTPSIAVQQSRIAAVMSLTSCQFSHNEPLHRFQSPLGWRVGDATGSYYRGALVGNFALFLYFVVLSAFLTLLVYDPSPGVNRGVVSSLRLLHLPGLWVVPIALLCQGTVSVATSLYNHGTHPIDKHLCLTTASVVILLWCAVMYLVTIGFRCESTIRESVLHDPTQPSWKRWLIVGLFSSTKWRDKPEVDRITGKAIARGFKQHWQPLFIDYREGYQWYFGFEMSLAIVVGILEGVKDPSTCNEVLWVFVALVSLHTTSAIFLRPFAAPFNTFFHIVISLGTCLAVGFGSATRALDQNSATYHRTLAASQWCALIVQFISVVKLSFDAVMLLRWFHSRYLRRQHERLGMRVRNFTQSLKSNHRGGGPKETSIAIDEGIDASDASNGSLLNPLLDWLLSWRLALPSNRRRFVDAVEDFDEDLETILLQDFHDSSPGTQGQLFLRPSLLAPVADASLI